MDETYFPLKFIYKVNINHYIIISLQEAMESFAFPNKINLISTEIKQKCSKLQFFSQESL